MTTELLEKADAWQLLDSIDEAINNYTRLSDESIDWLETCYWEAIPFLVREGRLKKVRKANRPSSFQHPLGFHLEDERHLENGMVVANILSEVINSEG